MNKNRLVSNLINNKLLLTPLVKSLLLNYSFKDDFIKYCIKENEEYPFITWKSLKVFINSNGWNWNKFVSLNLKIIIQSFGYLASSDITEEEFEIDDIDNFEEFLDSHIKNEIVINREKLLDFKSWSKNGRQAINDNSHKLLNSSKLNNENIAQIENEKNLHNKSYTKNKISDEITFENINMIKSSPHGVEELLEPYYSDRYAKLQNKFIKVLEKLPNKPKRPTKLNEIEINERIFIIGMVSKKSKPTSQLHHSKLYLVNYNLKCQIYALLSVAKLPLNEFPLGIVIGILGKVTDISYNEDWNSIIHITAESWHYPNSNYPTNKTEKEFSNESWVAVIGNHNISASTSQSLEYYNTLKNWLLMPNSNYRLHYILFIGGILPNQIQLKNKRLESYQKEKSLQSIRDHYEMFYSFLKELPSNYQFFIQPSEFDMTNFQIPQNPIHPEYQLKKGNVHFLSNPAKLILENSKLLIFNPFHFSNFKYYLEQPERLIIDLINFQHMSPTWRDVKINYTAYINDSLVIEDNFNYFIFNHLIKDNFSSYKQTNIGLISSYDPVSNKIPILIFNLHTTEKKVINLIVKNI